MPSSHLFSRLLPLLLLACAALSGCATNPVTGRPDLVFQSEEGEINKAKQVHPMLLQAFGGAYDDPKIQAYVNEVGQRAAKASHRPELQYVFTVLDSQDINAFTTGGGFVYITRGIMTYLNSEAELAAVLGHEIGHITARHPVRQQSQSTLAGIGAAIVGVYTGSGDLANLANYAGAAIVRGYGRDQELEADRLGAEYLVGIGYRSDHMIDVVRLLKNQELFELQRAREEKREPRVYHGVFSTHPDNDQRLREVVKAAEKLTGGADDKDAGRERYLKMIEGLPVGSSRAQGVFKGNRFYHANLGLTLAFPSGWNVENRADRLIAASPQKDSILQMQTQAPPPNTGPREFLSRLLARSSATQAEAIEVNGLQGYTAVVRAAQTEFGLVPVRYAVIYYNNLAYIFAGASKASSGKPAADPLFMSTIRTFRRLRGNEFALAEPHKIKIVRAGQNASVEDLARSSPLEKYPVETLRLLNDLYPNKQPEPGQLLKVVE
ncbi:MAG TPA: M48 family metalloprotease [Steroidobacter sp.]|jgi:predicted Zn-dependent protease|nr:M48 family metalloprotease [Steroidobacteraceae bacterium]HLS81924.1 M48 family metalloprotease [Steroidobacter sp.]